MGGMGNNSVRYWTERSTLNGLLIYLVQITSQDGVGLSSHGS